jgi:hypothetical protein
MNNLIPLLSFGLNILILVVSIAGFLKVMKNDLCHIQKDLTEIKDNQRRTDEKLDKFCERVSKIEGRLKKR